MSKLRSIAELRAFYGSRASIKINGRYQKAYVVVGLLLELSELVEKPAETPSSNRLASFLVRAPNS